MPSDALDFADEAADMFDLDAMRAHLLGRITATDCGVEPFRHLFVEEILPPQLYDALKAYMLLHKDGDKVLDRRQDSAKFVNKRLNLSAVDDPAVNAFRRLFTDPQVMLALLGKFYLHASPSMAAELEIHKEFEFFFTKAGRFQNIHVDIPPKFLSFVFYMPAEAVDPDAESENATILYDHDLTPHRLARYRANSVCIFAPHIASYHGFSSTIDRDVLVMFYISPSEFEFWKTQVLRQEEPPFNAMKDLIAQKMQRHPLIEFGLDGDKLAAERLACRINAPSGRVMRDQGDVAAPEVM